MKFTFKYWTDRYGDFTTVSLTHIPTGWHLDAIAHTGDCDRTGAPWVFSNFGQDVVTYPQKLGAWLEHAWYQIENSEWTSDVAQIRIQQLADWVSACERAEPEWPGWNR